ncbi:MULTISPECIES: hypothetical protein [Chromobacterium]|uniref:hypothetical protein n=1 Tax=Chromobacterium TaxID=535 RepID=UPI001304B063|nr:MULTISPECIES: hypothetical protein [Chromobacterium]MCP1288722.1 hypothetical protein [Chromobacterium sp. S0633]UJB32532.1 hypothetical protein HQN78_16625 [Chromobacterium sp. Beijing]
MGKQAAMIPGSALRRSRPPEKNPSARRFHAFKNRKLTPFEWELAGLKTPGV